MSHLSCHRRALKMMWFIILHVSCLNHRHPAIHLGVCYDSLQNIDHERPLTNHCIAALRNVARQTPLSQSLHDDCGLFRWFLNGGGKLNGVALASFHVHTLDGKLHRVRGLKASQDIRAGEGVTRVFMSVPFPFVQCWYMCRHAWQYFQTLQG